MDAGFQSGSGAQVQAQTLSGQADAAMRCIGGAGLDDSGAVAIAVVRCCCEPVMCKQRECMKAARSHLDCFTACRAIIGAPPTAVIHRTPSAAV